MATTGKTQHVIPRGDGWAVRGDGDAQDTFVTTTRREAVLRAREIARQNGADVVVHIHDDTDTGANDYANDTRLSHEHRPAGRIMIDPAIVHGKPHIKGTRIMVYQILDLLTAEKTTEEIITDYFPDLTKDDVLACIDYANCVIQGT